MTTRGADAAPLYLAANDVGDTEPRRRSPSYISDPDACIARWFADADRRGYTRFCAKIPTGTEGGPGQAVSSWAALTPLEQQSWTTHIRAWVGRGRQMALYSGLCQAASPTSVLTHDRSPLLRSRAYWRAAIEPWIDAGVTLIYWDILAAHPGRLKWLERQSWGRAKNGGESFPHLLVSAPGQPPVYDLDQRWVMKCPWIATAKVMETIHDPGRRWYAPPGTDLSVWHDSDGNDWLNETQRIELVHDWKRRGFDVAGFADARPNVQRAIMGAVTS